MRPTRPVTIRCTLAAALCLLFPAGALAHPFENRSAPANPLNDLFTVGLGFGQEIEKKPVQRNPEPKLEATPRAECGPGSRKEPGIQGRVPAGSATNGLTCNATLVGQEGSGGGFNVFRYVDKAGHECAIYDTALLFPLNAFNPGGSSAGVAVLDMSNPAKPVRTAMLTAPAMLSPHESLRVNTRRGLIAANNGNPGTEPGLVAVYDASADCRKPVLASNSATQRFGHESGFAPDGNTFYVTSTGTPGITAVDVSNPKQPHALWHGLVTSHGMDVSPDGNRAYLTNSDGRSLVILDTSEIQARKANPKAREISRLTWGAASIGQNAIPFTKRGRPYLLQFDEYDQGTTGRGDPDAVGAARIIDISDETKPRVLSNLRLQINQPAEHKAAQNDPGANSPTQGYAAHYCDIPTRVDPAVVACSFIASGLRVFDIRDLEKPKEAAYFVSPTAPTAENGGMPSNYAMSRPAFAPERREVWYSDGTTGFYAVRIDKKAWPGCSDRIGPPHGYVIRATLRGSRRGLSVRGSSFGLCLTATAASPSRVSRVTVSVGRYVGARCRFLTATGTLTATRSCRKPVALKVSGTPRAWRFASAKRTRLPKGRYAVYVQATDADGRRERQPARPNARFVVR